MRYIALGYPQGSGGFPQFSSELRYTLHISDPAISGLTIGGAPVDPGRTYRFCTNDYLLGGGDGYTILAEKASDPYNTSLLLSYVVIEYISSYDGPVTPRTDDRMTVMK